MRKNTKEFEDEQSGYMLIIVVIRGIGIKMKD